jgi:hypothetical protein
MKRAVNVTCFSLLLFGLSVLLVSPGIWADGGANHQKANSNYGVSGGNVNDITKRFCCSGTLGSLVTANGTNYILSNNHVLARADQAAPGEDISQPGLIENGCRPQPIVAHFSVAPPLGSNVDAAIAELVTGAMKSTGEIEDIGVPSDAVKDATIGLAVAKSGRTSGFTTGTIGSINATLNVQYQQNCGSGKKFLVSYTNQVVVNGSGFSAGGDSGSLIVTNNSCHQPVALLFAGSSSSTIGNPIGEVLTKVGTALGGSTTVTFVGQNCAGPNALLRSDQIEGPAPEAVQFAIQAMTGRERDLMSRAGVIGVGVGSLDSTSAEAAIVIYVDQTLGIRPRLPRRVNGVRVKVVYTDPFIAY